MAAKLIVTNTRGGSRITLVGTSGAQLLSSKVFTEQRAKGATLRSLKGLLGGDVVVEDNTTAVAPKGSAAISRATDVATGSLAKTNGEPKTARRKTATSK